MISVKERLIDILEGEKIKYEDSNLDKIINIFNGDLRAILNFIQFHSKDGSIEMGNIDRQINYFNDT